MSGSAEKTVQAKVKDAKFDIATGNVIANITVQGDPRTIVLDIDAVGGMINFDINKLDREDQNTIMLDFAEKFKERTMPFTLVLTDDQLKGDKNSCKDVRLI